MLQVACCKKSNGSGVWSVRRRRSKPCGRRCRAGHDPRSPKRAETLCARRCRPLHGVMWQLTQPRALLCNWLLMSTCFAGLESCVIITINLSAVIVDPQTASTANGVLYPSLAPRSWPVSLRLPQCLRRGRPGAADLGRGRLWLRQLHTPGCAGRLICFGQHRRYRGSRRERLDPTGLRWRVHRGSSHAARW